MILIILFILISVIAFLTLRDAIVKQTVFLFCGLMFIITAGFRSSNYTDYSIYVDYFNQKDSLFVEPFFILISKIIHVFTLNVIYLFIAFAILGVSIKLVAIKQLTTLWFLSFVIYAGNFFILHEMIQIRAGVASAFLLLCIKPIQKRNWKKFLLYSIFGIMFHYSALLVLPLYFLGNKPGRIWLLLAIPLGYLFYFARITVIGLLPIPGFQEKLEVYKQLQEQDGDIWDSINVFNLVFLTRIVIYYFILWKYRLITSYNKYTPVMLKIYSISLLSFLVFAQMPVVAFRISELFGIVEIVLIPLLFYTLRPRIASKAIVVFIGLSFLMIIVFYNKIVPL